MDRSARLSGFLLLLHACLTLCAQPAQPDLVLQGEVDGAQNKTYFEVPFDVSAGVHRLSVDFSYTGKDKHTTLDIGIADRVVEAGGQQHAGEWTPEKMDRLRALVDRAHTNGLLIRFYTLDGAAESELSCRGWFHGYNFGSLDAARRRWRAAIEAHVDYLASDQYELVASEIHQSILKQK